MQHLQVVADGGLGQVEGLVEVAYASLAAVVGGNQRHQPQSHRVGKRLEERRYLFGLRLAQGLPRQRGATGHRLGGGEREKIRVRHISILTEINGRSKAPAAASCC